MSKVIPDEIWKKIPVGGIFIIQNNLLQTLEIFSIIKTNDTHAWIFYIDDEEYNPPNKFCPGWDARIVLDDPQQYKLLDWIETNLSINFDNAAHQNCSCNYYYDLLGLKRMEK